MNNEVYHKKCDVYRFSYFIAKELLQSKQKVIIKT